MKMQKGFTLIEVLIALVIFAIAYLALSAMQVRALRDNYSSFLRSQASALAYDLADRVRANPVVAKAGGYHNLTGNAESSCFVTDTTATGCAPDKIANHDVFEWKETVKARLPNGQGTICYSTTPLGGCAGSVPNPPPNPMTYTIRISWTEADNSTQTFVTTFEP